MVKIRLSVTGKRNRRLYRIIAIEEGKRRDGRAIENLGFYDPTRKPAMLEVKKDRLNYWQSVGAQVSPAVQRLLSK